MCFQYIIWICNCIYVILVFLFFKVWYDPDKFLKAWDLMIKASDDLFSSSLFRLVHSDRFGINILLINIYKFLCLVSDFTNFYI